MFELGTMRLPVRAIALPLASAILVVVWLVTMKVDAALSWSTLGKLPVDLKVTAVQAVSDDEVLVGGCQSESGRLETCSSSIFRISASGTQQVYTGPGRVNVMAASGSTVFADVSVHDPDTRRNHHRLLRSLDGGLHFPHEVNIPDIQEATQLLAVTPVELWCLSGSRLRLSIDGGDTWAPVHTVEYPNPALDRLAVDGDYVYVLGDTVYRTRDRGASWSRVDTGGSHVGALRDGIFAGARPGKLELGRLAEQRIGWRKSDTVPEGVKPWRIASRGLSFVMVASPELVVAANVLLFAGRIEGGWTGYPIERVFQVQAVDMTGSGVVFAVQLGGVVVRGRVH